MKGWSFQLPSAIVSNFEPRRRLISNVTKASNAEVTTTEAHGYDVNQVVRLLVPDDYGMSVPYILAKVLTVPTTTTFTVDLDTSYFNAYVTPTIPPSFTDAQATPVTGLTNNNTSITG